MISAAAGRAFRIQRHMPKLPRLPLTSAKNISAQDDPHPHRLSEANAKHILSMRRLAEPALHERQAIRIPLHLHFVPQALFQFALDGDAAPGLDLRIREQRGLLIDPPGSAHPDPH